MSAALEAVPAHEMPAEAAVAPAQVAPERVEMGSADKITGIAQLPSIWTLKADIEWLIDGMIPLGSITLLSGESGGGKTWLAYIIAGAVARGESFADLKVQRCPVLYLDGENPLYVSAPV